MHPLFFHCVFLPEISGRFLSDPGQKLPVCCSLPLDFGGRSSLTSSHSENTDSHRLHDPSGKILRNITLLPDIKALPFLPALSQKLHMQSLSLSHPHIVRPFQFHSCIRKERIPWQIPRRHALKSQSLRWHYPNQVRSKIYLPLSLSHKLPLALFFSVFQYSTHLSRCQTSIAYCSPAGNLLFTPFSVTPETFLIQLNNYFGIKKLPASLLFIVKQEVYKSYFEISSIRRSSSAVNGAQWIAFTLSRICCGLEAPIRTLVTSLC